MKFFVPCAHDEETAEHVWAGMRQLLAEQGLPTTRRRIQALAWELDGEEHFVAVGGDTPDDEEELVVFILEASNIDFFYVCTPAHGVLAGLPYPVTLNERWRVIDFDEEVCGWA